MIAFAIVAIFLVLVPLLFLKKRKAEYPLYPIGIICLLIQATYLFIPTLLDSNPNSERWIFLALTYIPLSFSILITLTIFSAIKTKNIETGLGKLKSLVIIPIHGIGSYSILLAWGDYFQFPL
jgi:cell division protein FtsW (lipid II flippase)